MSNRDDKWLKQKAENLWDKYFSEVDRVNEIIIKFGVRAKRRLGSIRKDKYGRSMITVTGYFKDEKVPEYVVDETIVHELIHYTHGFSSSRKRMHKYPHRGSIIKNEMIERGVGSLWVESREWLELNWLSIIERK